MDINKLISIVCSMSDREVDPIIAKRLLALRDKPHRDILEEWLSILDDCCYGSLANDLIIHCLAVAWTDMGGTDELKEQLRSRRVTSK